MTDLMTLYDRMRPHFQKNRDDDLAIPLLNLKKLGCSVSVCEVGDAAEVLAEVNRWPGDGWLECTDAVRYRRETEWVGAISGKPDPIDAATRILSGEICGKDQSLRIRHLHEDTWELTTIAETGSGIAWDTAELSVLRLPQPTGLKRSQTLVLTLAHRTYWDAASARATAVRFIGFDERIEKTGGADDTP